MTLRLRWRSQAKPAEREALAAQENCLQLAPRTVQLHCDGTLRLGREIRSLASLLGLQLLLLLLLLTA